MMLTRTGLALATVAAVVTATTAPAFAAAPAAKKKPCTVRESGFTAVPSKATPGAFDVSVGFTVRAHQNVAGYSDVLVNFLDNSERIIASVAGEDLPPIRRGQTIPFGMSETDESQPTVTLEPSSIQVLVSCSATKAAPRKLPTGQVAAQLQPDTQPPALTFTVPVTNSTKKTWRYGTEIGFVVRDGSGTIVGGGVGQTYADLPARGSLVVEESVSPIRPDVPPYLVDYTIAPYS